MKNRENYKSPPGFAVKIFKKLYPDNGHFTLIGDIEEEYKNIFFTRGLLTARLWYLFQLVRSVFSSFFNKIYWGFIMFKNFLKTALRNMRRQKGYSFINITGLSISIAVFIFIMSFVWNELRYDKFHKNVDKIYQFGFEWHNGTAVPLAGWLQQNFPEIEGTVRFRNNYHSQLFKYEGNLFKVKNIYFADQSIFDVFSFKLLEGTSSAPLSEPYSIVLTESESKKMFGTENPLGKTIIYDNRWNFTVTGILEDLPSNSSFDFDALFSFSSLDKVTTENTGWNHSSSQTYVLLPEDYDKTVFEGKVQAFIKDIDRQQGRDREVNVYLRELSGQYFDIERGGRFNHGSRSNIYIFTAVSFIILLIACNNFINLSVARSAARANEVGLRKVFGSFRNQLIKQFLSESVLFSLTAAVLACILVQFLKPVFHNLIGSNIEIDFFGNPLFIIVIFCGSLLVGIIAGYYPAVHLTSFQPVEVLQGKISKGTKGNLLRKSLIIFQFTMSIILIFGTLTISRQLNFINNRDLGFTKDRLIWFDMSPDIQKSFGTFREKLQNNPGIEKVSATRFTKPGIESKYKTRIKEEEFDYNVFMVDADYIETMGLTMVDGRNFSKEITVAERSVILNETAVREFGLEDPVGKVIQGAVIIGVVRDFYFQSLHHEIEPLALIHNPPACNIVNARISSGNISETISFIENTWRELSPDYPLEYNFYDESFDSLYNSDKKFRRIFFYFSLIAIFIAGLGLYGLTSYVTAQRTKEIGIRKVLGASIPKITVLLSKEFLYLVIFACVIALPAAYYLMHNWLQNFAYRADISVTVFLFSVLISIGIALLTVSYHSIKAARSNPVDSLRYE
ncbi:ABC transporter permease [candidate division KSB1 bacterium]